MVKYAYQKFDFLDELDIDQDVKERLSILLQKTYLGNNESYVTPISKRLTPEVILAMWDKVFTANKHKMNSTLIDIEQSQRSKFGPRSISLPWVDRVEGVLESFKVQEIDHSALIVELPANTDLNSLRPINLSNALKLLKNNTNSGLPYYTKKGKIKDRLLEDFDLLLKRKDPCICFTRTQEQGKTRTVWGFPCADTLNEMRFFLPTLNYQKTLHWRSALLGPSQVSERLTYIISNAIKRNLTLVSVDFSAFDASVNPNLIRKAFDYIKSLYQSKHHSDLSYIEERFSSISLITPNGVLKGKHGVPSGSTFTNEVDSIVQYQVAKSSGVVEDRLLQIQGDDGVYAIPDDKIISLYSSFKRYGLNINPDKSTESRDYLVFLQCLYHNDYMVDGIIGGIYPVYRALNRILFQERWSDFEDYGIKGKDYYAIRTISILENCKFHPLFKELVYFIVEIDKYSLVPSQEGISQYIDMLINSSGVEGIIINQFGDEIRGIRSFETYKLIINKA